MAAVRELRGGAGTYEMHACLARGGMAVVHVGRAVAGPLTGRAVAIKQLDAKLASKPAFIAMFLDEGRLAMRIRHRNVVATLDVLENQGDLFHVLEYVAGETVGRLHREATERRQTMPLGIVSSVVCDALRGLDAAHHVSCGEESLGVVHRDISPQNILVGTDGVSRILDFGVAKSAQRVHWTIDGSVKGKVGYVAPEQLSRRSVTARADLYSLGVVLWELLTGRRLRLGTGATEMLREALRPVPAPSSFVPSLGEDVDRVIARACAIDPLERYENAAQMMSALMAAIPPASPSEVVAYVNAMADKALSARERAVRQAGIEERDVDRAATTVPPPPPDSQVHARLLRASTRPFTPQHELDQAYLALAGFADSSPVPSLRPSSIDPRGLTLAAPPRGDTASPRSSRRSVRSNVFYAPALAAAEAAHTEAAQNAAAHKALSQRQSLGAHVQDAARRALASRDELAAESARGTDSAPGSPLEGMAVSRRAKRHRTPTPLPGPGYDSPMSESFRRTMNIAACVLALAAAAILIVGFGGHRSAAARAPRTAYAWIGGYLMVIRGLDTPVLPSPSMAEAQVVDGVR